MPIRVPQRSPALAGLRRVQRSRGRKSLAAHSNRSSFRGSVLLHGHGSGPPDLSPIVAVQRGGDEGADLADTVQRDRKLAAREVGAQPDWEFPFLRPAATESLALHSASGASWPAACGGPPARRARPWSSTPTRMGTGCWAVSRPPQSSLDCATTPRAGSPGQALQAATPVRERRCHRPQKPWSRVHTRQQ